MSHSGMLRRVTLVRTDVSEEHCASFIRATRIDELGTTLVVLATDARFVEEIRSVRRLLVTATFLVHRLLSP
jgi:L-aminopeptidase/D-esterase-like protein